MEARVLKNLRKWSAAGMSNEEMKDYCTKLFPTLKRWKNNNS